MRPVASIVIPYGGGSAYWLSTQCDAVVRSAASFARGTVEIIVAANTRAAVDEAAQVARREGLEGALCVIDATRRRGPSAARNDGVRRASGELLLFCDADDVVDNDWVPAMVAALKADSLVSGVKRFGALNAPESMLDWEADTPELPVLYSHLPYAVGANLGVRRALFERLGGFDERLQCGEDVDFCWRAQYNGASIAVATDAVIEYRYRSGRWAKFTQAYRWGHWDALLVRLHRRCGIQRSLWQSLRSVMGLMRHLAGAIFGPGRERSAHRVGYHVGHIAGTIRFCTWAI